MTLFTAMVTTLSLLASTSASAQTLTISRSGSLPAGGGSFTFAPGARTTWHTRPRGQILIVTAGTGRVQRWGDPIEEIRQGDVVRIPPGQKHWHGASPDASMTHIAMTEHVNGGSVTFEPGARTAWHTHPRGQILIVTAGTGRVQRWGDPIEEIRQGDVVRIPPGQKHWHGASPNASMTHIALTEHLNGTRVQWMEKVSDEQYMAASSPARGASRE